MLTTLFLSIVQRSIQASIAILCVLLLRKFLRYLHAPRRLNTILWCAILFQLLCPLRIPIALFSITTPTVTIDFIQEQIEPSNDITPQKEQLSLTPMLDLENHGSSSHTDALLSTPQRPMQTSIQSILTGTISALFCENHLLLTLTIVWMLGCLALLFHACRHYLHFRQHIRTAYRVQEWQTVYYTGSNISMPFVLGMIKPHIYLPLHLTTREKSYILCHEQAHVKHGDYFLKPLAYFILCVHWFNPLVWIALQQMAIDMEYACDESVLSHFDETIKCDYCKSLLRFAQAPHYAAMPLYFGESAFASRIKDILQYHKPSFWAMCSSVLLVSCLCIGCAINPFAERADTLAMVTDGTASPADTTGQHVQATPTPTPIASPTPEPMKEETLTAETGIDDTDLADLEDFVLFWPIPSFTDVSRWSEENHAGADIVAPLHTDIFAMADGTVICCGYGSDFSTENTNTSIPATSPWNDLKGYGYFVIIQHNDNTFSLYAHCSDVSVTVGQTVQAETLIAHVGSTGYSTGNHCHIELSHKGVSLPLENLFDIE